MRHEVFTVMLAMLVVTGSAALAEDPPACPMGEGWESVPEFSDEFNGDALDGEKWWDFNPTWVGRRPGYFAREEERCHATSCGGSGRRGKALYLRVVSSFSANDGFAPGCAACRKKWHGTGHDH